MRQEVMQPDRLPARGAFREIAADIVIELQPALLFELHDQHRGKGLGDRADGESRGAGVGDVSLRIRHTVGFLEYHLPITAHQHGATEVAARNFILHHLVCRPYDCITRVVEQPAGTHQHGGGKEQDTRHAALHRAARAPRTLSGRHRVQSMSFHR
jgi:hypothetical protein